MKPLIPVLAARASALITVAREKSGVAEGFVSFEYSDGLGHKLSSVSEGASPGEFVVNNATLYDARGNPYRVFQPYYGPPSWAIPSATRQV